MHEHPRGAGQSVWVNHDGHPFVLHSGNFVLLVELPHVTESLHGHPWGCFSIGDSLGNCHLQLVSKGTIWYKTGKKLGTENPQLCVLAVMAQKVKPCFLHSSKAFCVWLC